MENIINQHLLVKCHVKNPPRSEEVLNDWFLKLVEKIEMNVCIPPRSYYVSKKGNEGITGQIGIETSHIALHCWDEESPALIQMDVYSCRYFNPEIVLEHLNQAFNVIDKQIMEIDRDNWSVKKIA
jgi:S-adenosylmethionine/arginine decarboxylase-like enzyme